MMMKLQRMHVAAAAAGTNKLQQPRKECRVALEEWQGASQHTWLLGGKRTETLYAPEPTCTAVVITVSDVTAEATAACTALCTAASL